MTGAASPRSASAAPQRAARAPRRRRATATTTVARADRGRGGERAVEHEVRRQLEQHAVLGAHRLALGGVDEDASRPAPARRRLRSLTAVGNDAPPRPRSPACSHALDQVRAVPAGRGPCSARCSAQATSGRSRVRAGQEPRQGHAGRAGVIPAPCARPSDDRPGHVGPAGRGQVDAQPRARPARRRGAQHGVVEPGSGRCSAPGRAAGRASPRCGPCAAPPPAAARPPSRMRSTPRGPPPSRMRRSTTAVPLAAEPLSMRPAQRRREPGGSGSATGPSVRRGRPAAARAGGEEAPARRRASRPAAPSRAPAALREPDASASADEQRDRARGAGPQRRRTGPERSSRQADARRATAATQAAVSASIHVGAGVRAGAEPVDERDRPARVGQPVHGAPRAVAEAPADQARDRTASSRSSATAPRPEPQRAVVAGERDDGVDEPDRRERVEHRGRADVDGEQRDREQRDGAVQRRDREARRAAPAARRRTSPIPSTTLAVSRTQRHRAGRRASRTRAPRVRARGSCGGRAPRRGQPATVCVAPSLIDQPRGEPARREPRRRAPRRARSPRCSRCSRPRRSRPRR